MFFVPPRFYIWDGEGCFACHTTFASLFPSSAGEREKERERWIDRERKKKKGFGGGDEGSRVEEKGAGARQKEKIMLLPGLMNMGKG